jgi:hypothetical protein
MNLDHGACTLHFSLYAALAEPGANLHECHNIRPDCMGILLESAVIRGRLCKSSGVWIMSRASPPCKNEHRLHAVTTAEHGPLCGSPDRCQGAQDGAEHASAGNVVIDKKLVCI